MRKYEYGTTVQYSVPSGQSGGGGGSLRSRNRWNPPQTTIAVSGLQLSRRERVANDLEEVPLAAGGVLPRAGGRIVRGRAEQRENVAISRRNGSWSVPRGFSNSVSRASSQLLNPAASARPTVKAALGQELIVVGRKRAAWSAPRARWGADAAGKRVRVDRWPNRRVVRQVDEHHFGLQGDGSLHRDVFRRVRRHRVPHREPRGNVRRALGDAVEAQDVGVVAVRG